MLTHSAEGSVGSPPRGRGKVELGKLRVNVGGITPAWAGKSCLVLCKRCRNWDHPRVGGEKRDSLFPLQATLGSPPRGRGKATSFSRFCLSGRITPAWAGKSTAVHCGVNVRKDHPRVGGEKLLSVTTIRSFLGSPPRGRGKVEIGNLLLVGGGITPAWAGKSQSQPPAFPPVQDHPRVGGEK